MFNAGQLNRIEIAIARLRDDLRLKEQQDRIEAQQKRIEDSLGEVLEWIEQSGGNDAAAQVSQLADDTKAGLDSLKSEVK